MATKNHFLLFSLIILLCSASLNAQNRLDSLKAVADEQFKVVNGESIERVEAFLQTTSLINRLSPTDALFYINGLEAKLNRINAKVGKGEVLLNKGNYYWSIGIYNIALKTYFEALRYFEKQNNTEQLIRILNNIGETYKKQQNYAKAQEFLQKALNLLGESGDEKFLLIKVNIAQLNLLNNELDSANKILSQILSLASIEKEITTKGFAYLYKGIVKKKTGQPDSAYYCLNKALEIWKETSLNRYIAETLSELAELEINSNNFTEAHSILKRAEQRAKLADALDVLMRIYKYQIELIESSRENDSLGYYYKKYVQVKDSIYNEASRKEINKLTVQYDLADKEKDYYKLALEQNILENANNRQQALLVLLGLILLIVTIFSFLQLRKRRQLAFAHSQLQRQKEEIERKQKQLSEKSLELAKLNQELYGLNRNLEEKVIERSEQLNIKNKQIAEFTFYNSHKLRAPVASILGLINVMELNKEGKVDEYLIDHLKTSAVELDEVIHKLKFLLDNELIEEIGKKEY